MPLRDLFDRNVAWAEGKTRSDPHYFRRMAEQHSPRYLWIGVSNSRVTANDVLGLNPGAVFVQRNIANIVHTSDMNLISVLEYRIGTHHRLRSLWMRRHRARARIGTVSARRSLAAADRYALSQASVHFRCNQGPQCSRSTHVRDQCTNAGASGRGDSDGR